MATVLERYSSYTPASFGGATSKYIIESNIPLPPRKFGTNGRPTTYPFAHMRVGDSFEVNLSEYTGKHAKKIEQVMTTIGNCARGYAKRHNPTAKFTTRKMSQTAARIWRTA
jgi:hypothetical protein